MSRNIISVLMYHRHKLLDSLQWREADQATITATGKSASKCQASAKIFGSSRNDKAPVSVLGVGLSACI
jgi:hypothetical protein